MSMPPTKDDDPFTTWVRAVTSSAQDHETGIRVHTIWLVVLTLLVIYGLVR